MTGQYTVPMRYLHERYLGRPSCAKCGELVMAPQSSEHRRDCDIRHVWVCDACDYQFGTLVTFKTQEAPRIA